MRHDPPARTVADDFGVALRAVLIEEFLSARAPLLVDRRQSRLLHRIRPAGRLQRPQPVLEVSQVVRIRRGLKVDVRRPEPLAAQHRGDGPALPLLPVERREDADHLARVPADRADAGIGADAVPLHVVMLRDIPDERITHGRVRRVEQAIAQHAPLLHRQQRDEAIHQVIAVLGREDRVQVCQQRLALGRRERARQRFPQRLRTHDMFEHAVVDPAERVQPRVAVRHRNLMARLVRHVAVVEERVGLHPQRVGLQIVDDVLLGRVIAGFQDRGDEALALRRVGVRGGERRRQRVDEFVHVRTGRSAVDAQAHAVVVHLRGVARRARVAEVFLAAIRIRDHAHRQRVGVAPRRLLRQVAVAVHVLRRTKRLLRLLLFDSDEEVIRQKVRALRRRVEPHAVGRGPSLVEVLHVLEGVAEDVCGCRGRAALGIALGHPVVRA